MTQLLNRRSILQTTGAGIALTALSGCFSGDENSASTDASGRSEGKQAQPGPLKEMTLGDVNAPIKVVEYASMTCPHCASFHNLTYHALKEKYIDTGKVLFAFREFPLDQLAATVSVLARCAPEDKFFNVIDVFFKTQSKWRSSQNPLAEITEITKQLGFTQQSVEKCLQNQEVIDGINTIRKHGIEVMKVEATPSFYINGKKISGALTIDQFDKEFEGLL